MRQTLSSRFWSKVDVAGEKDCWLWLAGTNGSGYGAFGIDGRGIGAHRIAYELVRGPIPAGLSIDHLCRNRLCVNPEHLEAITQGENNRRMHAARGTCRSGRHPMTDVYVTPAGYRTCRECRREYDRMRQARRTESIRTRKAERKVCANGHPWNSENVRVDRRGYSYCRPCGTERQREHRFTRAYH